MGRPKALLPWAGVTLIEYQVRELRAAGCEVTIVLGHAAEEIRPRVPLEARVVLNEAYPEGRASSLRAGAAALPDDADPILVLSVDQPRPREVIESLLAAHRRSGALITVPLCEGKRGHPAVLSGTLVQELRAASEEAQGLRGVIANHETSVREAAFATPVVLLDINTEADYERAKAQRGASPLG
jgi:molybdenum cofactor cytidylyltransferase